jgi:hypothetical protein
LIIIIKNIIINFIELTDYLVIIIENLFSVMSQNINYLGMYSHGYYSLKINYNVILINLNFNYKTNFLIDYYYYINFLGFWLDLMYGLVCLSLIN